MNTSTQTETEIDREFRKEIAEVAKLPDGPRRLRFVATLMAERPIPKLTPDEVLARYEEFCKKEVKA